MQERLPLEAPPGLGEVAPRPGEEAGAYCGGGLEEAQQVPHCGPVLRQAGRRDAQLERAKNIHSVVVFGGALCSGSISSNTYTYNFNISARPSRQMRNVSLQ